MSWNLNACDVHVNMILESWILCSSAPHSIDRHIFVYVNLAKFISLWIFYFNLFPLQFNSDALFIGIIVLILLKNPCLFWKPQGRPGAFLV